MPKKRQPVALIHPPGHGADVTTLSYDFRPGFVVTEHVHDEDQIVYGLTGVMTVRTRDGMWVVPPQRAVWVPSRVSHAIDMSGAVTMKTVYLAKGLVTGLPRTCCVLNVSALLRELIVRACTTTIVDTKVPRNARMVSLLIDELHDAPSVALQLPNPLDPRALRIAQMLVLDPSDPRPLDQLCTVVGASKRTIERVFQAETTLTYGRWRQQLSLLHAMRLLAAGAKVSSAAVDAGYSSASAFISMFRRTMGTTPGEYFKEV